MLALVIPVACLVSVLLQLTHGALRSAAGTSTRSPPPSARKTVSGVWRQA
ncbi:MAG: hypothetical protein Q8S33_31430 [Myxococcales bacterium]|nr:hypothetical protein [Myxococcales bacterium]MDP3504891.1 hypothetical protein [Myxococcales bacterium]